MLGSHAIAQRANRLTLLLWFGGAAALLALIALVGAVLLVVLVL